MLNLDIVLQYINTLYKAEPADCPGYDEFRDMFSGGQVQSKHWIISEIKKISEINSESKKNVIVCGAWFGVLAFMLESGFDHFEITSLDLDERCFNFINAIKAAEKIGSRIRSVKSDMFLYEYAEDLVINTSCEHIENLSSWLSKIPNDAIVVLQSSDLVGHPQHINCVHSAEDLISQAGVEKKVLYYKGTLQLPTFKRFMIIFKN